MKVGIVGGGLAGLAAATALCTRGIPVALYEGGRRLGGRAGSFYEPVTGDWIDHCQHVNLGCCVNYTDFCRRTGIAECFRRHKQLNFLGPDGVCSTVQAARWLPSPMHLSPALLRLGFLHWRDRWSIARAMGKLARGSSAAEFDSLTFDHWLRKQHQSQQAINGFWSVVLVSALSETVERVSVAAARKVFVDGFLASRWGYAVDLPTVPLNELYRRVAARLAAHGVELHCESPVRQVPVDRGGVKGLQLGAALARFDAVIVAVPWRRLSGILDTRQVLPDELVDTDAGDGPIESSPIASVHLWFDRPIMRLPHAVLIGRLSQWIFGRPAPIAPIAVRGEPAEHYYQVVISAARDLVGRNRDVVRDEVLEDLRAVFPDANGARLLRWQLVNQQHAVFSMRPGIESSRPSQQTRVPGLFLAGDWTRTGWPATMEGAVRSGYLAAEALLKSLGQDESFVLPEPRNWLARRWMRS